MLISEKKLNSLKNKKILKFKRGESMQGKAGRGGLKLKKVIMRDRAI